jgi:general secretion pathway protein J
VSARFLSRSSSLSGFSLLEALAALGLTGMLFATGLPLFVQLVRNWSAGTARLMAADEWMSATNRMSDDLAQALPLKMAHSGDKAVAFRGSAREIHFVRTSLGGKGDFRLESVSLVIESRGDGTVDVVRIARPFSITSFETSPPISEGVSLFQLQNSATFDYLDVSGKRYESWDPSAGLPNCVELKLSADDAKMTGIPSFVFPIVAGST